MKKLPKRMVKTKPEFKKLPKKPKLGPFGRRVTLKINGGKAEFKTLSEVSHLTELRRAFAEFDNEARELINLEVKASSDESHTDKPKPTSDYWEFALILAFVSVMLCLVGA